MNPRALILTALAAAIVGGTSACTSHAQPPTDPAQLAAWQALRDAGPGAPFVIYPARVLNRPDRTVAEVIALILEKQGMDNLDIAAAEFVPPPDADWNAVQSGFSAFVARQPTGSAYSLYAEFLGDPKTGPTEVRFLVLDPTAQLVLSDLQTPSSKAFKRTAARDPDPMGCSVLVATRLFTRLDWKEQAVEKGKGKFAQLWAEKSGTPSDAERAAMEKRAAELTANLIGARVTVYATLIGEQTDGQSAERLAEGIAKSLGCRASASDRALGIRLAPSSNEQKRLWDLARALRDALRAEPCETEYAVLAEYYIGPGDKSVHAVHFVLCDKAGDWVVVDFQNDQWEDFQRLAPRSAADCDRLAIERLEKRLK